MSFRRRNAGRRMTGRGDDTWRSWWPAINGIPSIRDIPKVYARFSQSCSLSRQTEHAKYRSTPNVIFHDFTPLIKFWRDFCVFNIKKLNQILR